MSFRAVVTALMVSCLVAMVAIVALLFVEGGGGDSRTDAEPLATGAPAGGIDADDDARTAAETTRSAVQPATVDAPGEAARDATSDDSPRAARDTLPDGFGGLRVAVVDGRERPRAGVEVALATGRRRFRATSGADGVADFRLLPAASYTVQANAPRSPLLHANRDVRVTSGVRESITVVLASLDASIAGAVKLASGEPAIEVEVRAEPVPGDASRLLLLPATPPRVLTDATGRFEIAMLAAGEYGVTVHAGPGFAPVRETVSAPAEYVDLVLHGERRVAVSGTVRDPDGEPIPGATVSEAISPGSAVTDQNGAFRLEVSCRDTRGATIVISARKRGYRRAEQVIRVDEAAGASKRTAGRTPVIEVDLVVEPAAELATITGRIVDGDGAPVIGERVHLRSARLNEQYSAASDAAGRFVIEHVLVSDDYRLWVYPRRMYRDSVTEPYRVSAGANELEIVLERLETGSISGTLIDASGAPLPGFAMRLRSRESLASSIAVRTDDEGRFEAAEVPAGQLVLERQSAPRVLVHGIAITADEETRVEVTIGAGDRTVRGAVTSAEGEPIGGARLEVRWESTRDGLRSSLAHDAIADESGRFAVSGLAPGGCTATATAPGFRPAQTRFEIPPEGDADELAITLEAQ